MLPKCPPQGQSTGTFSHAMAGRVPPRLEGVEPSVSPQPGGQGHGHPSARLPSLPPGPHSPTEPSFLERSPCHFTSCQLPK